MHKLPWLCALLVRPTASCLGGPRKKKAVSNAVTLAAQKQPAFSQTQVLLSEAQDLEPDVLNQDGEAALHLAIVTGDIDIVMVSIHQAPQGILLPSSFPSCFLPLFFRFVTVVMSGGSSPGCAAHAVAGAGQGLPTSPVPVRVSAGRLCCILPATRQAPLLAHLPNVGRHCLAPCPHPVHAGSVGTRGGRERQGRGRRADAPAHRCRARGFGRRGAPAGAVSHCCAH